MRSIIADLTPALGRQDHTTSPYALAPFVIGTSASTASRPAFRDDREPPLLVGRDERIIQAIWVKSNYFPKNRTLFLKNGSTLFLPSRSCPTKPAFGRRRMRGGVGGGGPKHDADDPSLGKKERAGFGGHSLAQCPWTPTPDPRERASLASDPARGRGIHQIIRATNGIFRTHTVTSQLEANVPTNTIANLTPAAQAGS
jgi:hypothetical protein